MPTRSREVRLARRPVGFPSDADFELATVTLPDPGVGELLIRNLWMSVDPYMRGRMNDAKSYTPPFALGEALQGGLQRLPDVAARQAVGRRRGG